MRAPWKSPSSKDFSWSTLWMNMAALVTVLKYFSGDAVSLEYGSLTYHPGALDPTLVAAVMGTLGGLYGWRRSQEGTAAPAIVKD